MNTTKSLSSVFRCLFFVIVLTFVFASATTLPAQISGSIINAPGGQKGKPTPTPSPTPNGGDPDATWSGGGSGNGTSWTTGTNWVGGTASGSVGTTTNADIATIPATGANPAIGIAGTTYYLGTIDFTSSTANRAIGASGTTGATLNLQLNGRTVNGIADTILRNEGTSLLTLQPNNGQSTPNTLQIVLGDATNNVVNIDSTGGINIGVAITGVGRNLTLNGTGGGILTFSGSAPNTYSGTTTVNAGELDLNKTAAFDAIAGALTIGDGVGGAGTAIVKLLADSQIKNTGTVTINSDGLLNMNGKSETIAGLNGTGTVDNTLAASTSTLTVGGTSSTFAGVIKNTAGTLQLVRDSGGTLTLTNNNTYSGATSVNNGGVLEVNNTGTTGKLVNTSSIFVNNGGTLLLSGSASVNDRLNNNAGISLNGGATLRAAGVSEGLTGAAGFGMGALTLSGAAASVATIDFSGTSGILNFNGFSQTNNGSILNITNWVGKVAAEGGGGAEQLLFVGSASTFQTTFTQSEIEFDGTAGYRIVDHGTWFEVTAIPEPSTWVAAALAAAVIGYTLRRRFTRVLARA